MPHFLNIYSHTISFSKPSYERSNISLILLVGGLSNFPNAQGQLAAGDRVSGSAQTSGSGHVPAPVTAGYRHRKDLSGWARGPPVSGRSEAGAARSSRRTMRGSAAPREGPAPPAGLPASGAALASFRRTRRPAAARNGGASAPELPVALIREERRGRRRSCVLGGGACEGG